MPAIRKLSEKLQLDVDEFDLFENNEAFALNNVLLRKLLEIPYDRVNVYGARSHWGIRSGPRARASSLR